MANEMTKQDLFSATELAKNKIIERLVTKYDVQAASDSARDRILAAIADMHQENEAFKRQASAQNDQVWRKLVSLQAQLNEIQTEIKALNQALSKLTPAA